MKLKEQKIAQVVIGSGAAGFQSALRLYQNGEWDLTVVTENINAVHPEIPVLINRLITN